MVSKEKRLSDVLTQRSPESTSRASRVYRGDAMRHTNGLGQLDSASDSAYRYRRYIALRGDATFLSTSAERYLLITPRAANSEGLPKSILYKKLNIISTRGTAG